MARTVGVDPVGPGPNDLGALHGVRIEQVGEAAREGPQTALSLPTGNLDLGGEQNDENRPRETVETPRIAVVVGRVENPGDEVSGKEKVDVGRDPEPMSETGGHVIADSDRRHDDHFGGEGIVEGTAQQFGEGVEERVEILGMVKMECRRGHRSLGHTLGNAANRNDCEDELLRRFTSRRP